MPMQRPGFQPRHQGPMQRPFGMQQGMQPNNMGQRPFLGPGMQQRLPGPGDPRMLGPGQNIGVGAIQQQMGMQVRPPVQVVHPQHLNRPNMIGNGPQQGMVQPGMQIQQQQMAQSKYMNQKFWRVELSSKMLHLAFCSKFLSDVFPFETFRS